MPGQYIHWHKGNFSTTAFSFWIIFFFFFSLNFLFSTRSLWHHLINEYEQSEAVKRKLTEDVEFIAFRKKVKPNAQRKKWMKNCEREREREMKRTQRSLISIQKSDGLIIKADNSNSNCNLKIIKWPSLFVVYYPWYKICCTNQFRLTFLPISFRVSLI